MVLITTLMGSLTAAIVALFWRLMAAQDAQIDDLQRRLDRVLELSEGGQEIARDAVRRTERHPPRSRP